MRRLLSLSLFFLACGGGDPAVRRRPIAAAPRCDGVRLEAAGRSYCLHEVASWDQAKATCASAGGVLAAPANAGEDAALAAALRSKLGETGRAWIGLFETSEDHWAWKSGESARFGAWGPGEPNNSGGDEACAEMHLPSGAWNDLRCGDPLGYLCERVFAGPMSCTGRSIVTPRGEYCLYTNAQRSWPAAGAACEATGGMLAAITTDEEQRALVKAIGGPLSNDRVWLGVTDAAVEGTWLDARGARQTFFGWGPGEPNDSGGEDCAELLLATGKWNDLACSATRPFVCEP